MIHQTVKPRKMLIKVHGRGGSRKYTESFRLHRYKRAAQCPSNIGMRMIVALKPFAFQMCRSSTILKSPECVAKLCFEDPKPFPGTDRRHDHPGKVSSRNNFFG